MNVNNIISFVEKNAPLLATALSGPYGGIATTALTLIAHAFSADPNNTDDILSKMQSDTNAAVKLKELQLAHVDFLTKAKVDVFSLEIQDRQSARSMQKDYLLKTGHQDYMIPFLVIMIFVSMAACVYCMITYSTIVGETIAFIMGTFREELKNIYSMYFGGNASNQEVADEPKH